MVDPTHDNYIIILLLCNTLEQTMITGFPTKKAFNYTALDPLNYTSQYYYTG